MILGFVFIFGLGTNALAEDVPYARPECSTNARISGAISTGDSILDLSQSGVQVWLQHKMDIDEFEDQCINEVYIQSMVQNRGCEFRLTFQAQAGRDELVLTEATLVADSFCPGWPDSKEGDYRWINGLESPTLMMSEAKVPDRTADRSCTDLSLQIDGMLPSKKNGGRKVDLVVDNMTINGVFDSIGSTAGICPSATSSSSEPQVLNGWSVSVGLGVIHGATDLLILRTSYLEPNLYVGYINNTRPALITSVSRKVWKDVSIGISTILANSEYTLDNYEVFSYYPARFNFTSILGEYPLISRAQLESTIHAGLGIRRFENTPMVDVNPYISPIIGVDISRALNKKLYFSFDGTGIVQPQITDIDSYEIAFDFKENSSWLMAYTLKLGTVF